MSSIGRDVSDILLYAAQKTDASIKLDSDHFLLSKAPNNEYTYTSTWGNGGKASVTFEPKEYVWSPANYTPWAKELEQQLHLKPEANATDTSAKFIDSLAKFSSQSIAKSNHDVSEELCKHPLDATANEEAALLCSLYAMRENAACFTDTRPWMNRIAAHLAIAESARNGSPMSDAGELSNATLLCLAGRTTDALSQLNKMKAPGQSTNLQSWIRALRIRATHDYRIADKDHSEFLEQLEYGRALATNLGSDSVTDYLESHSGEADQLPIDWVRIGARGITSVEAGHRYTLASIGSEFQDLAADLKSYTGHVPRDEKSLIATLDERPTGCMVKDGETWSLQPISWNDLSDYHCRHILDSGFQTYRFLKSVWGVPDQAKEFAASLDTKLSGVRTYPLCKLNIQIERGDHNPAPEVVTSIGKLSKETPETIPYDIWKLASKSAAPEELDNPGIWFVPLLPFGTTYDYDYRSAPQYTLAELTGMKDMNPYNADLVRKYAGAKYDAEHPNLKLGALWDTQLAEAFGPIIEYNARAQAILSESLWEDDKEKYAQLAEKMAKGSPDKYYSIGLYYQSRDPKKAVVAFEKAVSLGRNPVLFANNCDWLVNYYYDHGKKAEAQALAQRAADVYSGQGLMTMASLCERMGKLPEAEDYFKKITERYATKHDLCAFYLRNASKNSVYRTEGDKLLKTLCPGGLKKFDPAVFNAAPTSGTVIKSVSYRTADAGIEYGNVVVGINGYAIKNEMDYQIAIRLPKDATTELNFWQGLKKYKTAKIPVGGYVLGVEVESYHH